MRLTLLGRSLVLISTLTVVNVVSWSLAAILFARKSDSILSLALLAWTLGLRHALDADHISVSAIPHLNTSSAIDNATRGLINMGQLPVTCGLFFSLGHSTIVVVVNIAIAISSSIYNKLNGVGTVGGIVGAAVSGSFLFLVGFANSIIFWRIIRQRQRAKQRREKDLPHVDEVQDSRHNHMLMMRILGPVISFVDKPWKMYPVGLLFGFGFDTASSIALLAVSALAHKRSDGSSIPSGEIVILPLLFTAGMTLIDSADSILMLYSYSGFPDRTWTMFDRENAEEKSEELSAAVVEKPAVPDPFAGNGLERGLPLADANPEATTEKSVHSRTDEQQLDRDLQVKLNVMSGLSIVLTLMSILVAFSISLITIMALIGEQCARCQRAATATDGGGLAGRWWRGWAKANDNSGYIGAAIVGAFVGVVAFWYASRRLLSARQTVTREEAI